MVIGIGENGVMASSINVDRVGAQLVIYYVKCVRHVHLHVLHVHGNSHVGTMLYWGWGFIVSALTRV